MAIAYDVSTVATAYTATGTQTTSHAGSASARAAVVLIDQNAIVTDQVSGVTYGGTAMTRLGFDTEATEAGGVYIYWLDGVTGGTQNVAMTTTGTANKQLVVATMTAAAGSTVAVAGENTGTSASAANPSWTISGLTAGTKLECFEAIHSGLTSMTTTPASGWTLISSTDLGAQGRGFARQSVASSGTTCACGWTASTADDFVGSSVSFKEVAGGPVTLAASGTIAATTAVTGDATRVPLTLAVTGTIAVIATTSGNAVRTPLTLVASGTIPVASGTSGNPACVLAISGTSPAITSTSGDATRVPLTLAASGTVLAITSASGSVIVTVPGGQTLTVSGQVAVTSTASGGVTRTVLVLAASGTVVVIATTSGDATRLGLILVASGTVGAVSGVTGAVILTVEVPLVLNPGLALTVPASALALAVPAHLTVLTVPNTRLEIT